MPESVKDRPTKAHEYLFLLTKSPEYYYDYIAILEDNAYDGRKDTLLKGSAKYEQGKSIVPGSPSQGFHAGQHERWPYGEKRNRRSVWRISTKGFQGAHFAVFPPALVEPCILAGTSEYGNCANCGAPFERVIAWQKTNRHASEAQTVGSGRGEGGDRSKHAPPRRFEVKGWQPTCECHGRFVKEMRYDEEARKSYTVRVYMPDMPIEEQPVVPPIVLDPFMGSGTTLEVALSHGRAAIGIDVSSDYAKLAQERLTKNVKREWTSSFRFVI